MTTNKQAQATDDRQLALEIATVLDKATDPVCFAELMRSDACKQHKPADVLATMAMLTNTSVLPHPMVDVAMMHNREGVELMVFALHGRPLPYPGEDWYAEAEAMEAEAMNDADDKARRERAGGPDGLELQASYAKELQR